MGSASKEVGEDFIILMSGKMKSQDLVSVIIPTYNSARTIEKTLLSVRNQTYQAIELIVVDNNSTDATKNIAEQYADKVINFGPERTFQKNEGIRQATGKYVFFVDSDMELIEEVVQECVDAMKTRDNDKVWGVCISERSIGEWLFVQIRDFERSFYTGTSVDSARFFLLEDVKKVWGFEEDLIFFEESLLPQKIEAQLWKSTKFYTRACINHNEDKINLISRLKKKYYYWKSLDQYKQKVKELGIGTTQQGQTWILGRYLIFLKNKRFYTKPWLALGVLVLKTLEFAAGGVGVCFSRFR